MGSGCRHMSTRWRFLFFLEWRAATSKRSWSVILGSSSAKKNSVQVIPDTERERERDARETRESVRTDLFFWRLALGTSRGCGD